MYATNCWVIAPKAGSECVVIDPGMPDVSQQLDEILKKHSLKPVAVIATPFLFSLLPMVIQFLPTFTHSIEWLWLILSVFMVQNS
jgi:hydroxyacylglutathione hydrolase